MPGRPLRPCKHRGCSALVAGGKTYCEQHVSEAVKWKPDAVRGNRHERGYGSAWTKRRARILLRDCCDRESGPPSGLRTGVAAGSGAPRKPAGGL